MENLPDPLSRRGCSACAEKAGDRFELQQLLRQFPDDVEGQVCVALRDPETADEVEEAVKIVGRVRCMLSDGKDAITPSGEAVRFDSSGKSTIVELLEYRSELKGQQCDWIFPRHVLDLLEWYQIAAYLRGTVK